jgi:hypothetical protein
MIREERMERRNRPTSPLTVAIYAVGGRRAESRGARREEGERRVSVDRALLSF